MTDNNLSYKEKAALVNNAGKSFIDILDTEVEKNQIAARRANSQFDETFSELRKLKAQVRDLGAVNFGMKGKIPFYGASLESERSQKISKLKADIKVKEKSCQKLDKERKGRGKNAKSFKNIKDYLVAAFTIIRKSIPRLNTEDFQMMSEIFDATEEIRLSKIINKANAVLKVFAEYKAYFDRTLSFIKSIGVKASPASSGKLAEEDFETLENAPSFFLPVPESMNKSLIGLGVREDQSVLKGNNLYLIPSQDMDLMKRVQKSLPFAMRREKSKFNFAPIPDARRGVNIRTTFTTETWDSMKANLVSAKGCRCVICGGQGGQLLSQYKTPEPHKRNSVEAHELWDWEILDRHRGIGLQTLKEILIVCHDCHMMFHEDVVLGKLDSSKHQHAKEMLSERRQLLTGMTASEILNDFQDLEALSPLMAETGTWVMDLSYLSSHDYLNCVTPIISEENAAGVHPTHIAGIDMFNMEGEFYQQRSLADIKSELTKDIDRENAADLFM